MNVLPGNRIIRQISPLAITLYSLLYQSLLVLVGCFFFLIRFCSAASVKMFFPSLNALLRKKKRNGWQKELGYQIRLGLIQAAGFFSF